MLKDIVGMKFGKLNVISRAINKGKVVRWYCSCDCGGETIVYGSKLRAGLTKSCGCLHREVVTKHGNNTNDGRTSEYNSWNMMKNRCLVKSTKQFKDYGGRGITICEEWLEFENFLRDMGKKPSPEHSLDRIDNEKGYYPENCKWSTRSEQQRNQRVRSDNALGVRGIHYNKRRKKYLVVLYVEGVIVYKEAFENLEEAIEARKQAELKYW